MTMGRPTCATCAAFDEAKNRCRRRPPDPRHGWPDVGADSWCLEHVTEEDAFPIARQWGMMDRADAERKQEREINEAIASEMNSRLAAAGLPPIDSDYQEAHVWKKALDAHLAAGASIDVAMRQAYYAVVAEATAQQTTQGPKPATPAAPTPSPEPDSQGL